MRCDQLAEICKRYLGDEYEFLVRAQRPIRNQEQLSRVCNDLEGCIVILLKGTAYLFGEEGMNQLRRSARAVCIDYVDADAYKCFSRFVDVHIGASHAGCRLLKEVVSEKGADSDCLIMHLPHHADPRLSEIECRPKERLQMVYLGNPANTHVPEALNRKVELLGYPRDAEIAEVFDALGDFNMHYCVRSPPTSKGRKTVAKPFTKGFTAAAVGAHVITARDTDDAIDYLGEDYPFFIDDVNERAILEAVKKAEALFDSTEWRRALERMDHVRHLTAPPQVARRVREILTTFT